MAQKLRKEYTLTDSEQKEFWKLIPEPDVAWKFWAGLPMQEVWTIVRLYRTVKRSRLWKRTVVRISAIRSS